jgi:hypothetical protein
MVRRVRYRRLRDGQTTILTMAQVAAVTRESLNSLGDKSRGLKGSLFSVTRLGLIDKQGRITEAGRDALKEGRYPIEADPIEAAFERNVDVLMKAWKVTRGVAVRRAVANQVKAIDDKGAL